MSMYPTRHYHTIMARNWSFFGCDQRNEKTRKKSTKIERETEATPTEENELNSVHRVCKCWCTTNESQEFLNDRYSYNMQCVHCGDVDEIFQ